MKVERIYRRQWAGSPTEFIRDVCREVSYHGRYLWLVEANSVPLAGPSSGRNSHIRYRLVDLRDGPQIVPLTGRDTRIIFMRGSRSVVVAVPVLHGRRRTGFLFMRSPEKYKWAKATNYHIMPEEVAVLRRKADACDRATYEVARACCLHRGLIHPNGDLTPDGLELLRWHDSIKSRNRS